MTDTEQTNDDITNLDQRSLVDRVKDFSDLLNKIDNLDSKTAQLWKEIYENAITDRQNSFAMFYRLVAIAGDKTTEHAVHGRTMSNYIERMSKANDQLIRLAELVSKFENKEKQILPDDVFSAIANGKGKH
jgi:hypothetical protein